MLKKICMPRTHYAIRPFYEGHDRDFTNLANDSFVTSVSGNDVFQYCYRMIAIGKQQPQIDRFALCTASLAVGGIGGCAVGGGDDWQVTRTRLC